jgi:RNA polymerase sigma-70 factor (ECF subfamily)
MYVMERFLFAGDDITALAIRMRGGDQSAATALYRSLVNKTFGFCMTRIGGNRAVAEDLTQEIFLKLVNRIDTFDPDRGSFPVWFWQLARNTVIDYHRREKEIPASDLVSATETDGDEVQYDTPEPNDRAAEAEARYDYSRILAFVRTLSPDDQTLFELRFVGELSYDEVGAVVGKDAGALRVAVNRLRKKIRDAFPHYYA